MRDIIPYVFWSWFAISCIVLLRRRITGGSWKAMAEKELETPIEFPPPPPRTASDFDSTDPVAEPTTPQAEAGTVAEGNPADVSAVAVATEAAPSPGAVAVAPRDPARHRSRTLAEAVEGIAMPCDLAPLMGTGALDPREVAFFTTGHDAATVGFALSDELERLGFVLTPIDDRTIRAENGPDLVRARLISTALTSEDVMSELHPSAPSDALVVEMKLT